VHHIGFRLPPLGEFLKQAVGGIIIVKCATSIGVAHLNMVSEVYICHQTSCMWDAYPELIRQGNIRAISRCISLIENEVPGYEQLLLTSSIKNIPVVGITGPPGAGKSTLTEGLINAAVNDQKKVAVLCVDPSSSFTYGSILGDRIRMNKWFNEPNVYIRSLATRGSLGGLHPMIIQITDLLKSADFDLILIETVGIGQSEIEIAELADICLLVLVPESGDDIQTMKAGVMEIADMFVINKSDRDGADLFIKNLKSAFPHGSDVPVLKTVASNGMGLPELYHEIIQRLNKGHHHSKQRSILARKAYQLIMKKRMANIDVKKLNEQISAAINEREFFNVYLFVQNNY
jgi:LAO/AO transport system kinase